MTLRKVLEHMLNVLLDIAGEALDITSEAMNVLDDALFEAALLRNMRRVAHLRDKDCNCPKILSAHTYRAHFDELILTAEMRNRLLREAG
ncbi:MAG TPA: hypothetical protein VFZ48_00575, partial [Candidatus Saccharimonadales bacterium]